MYLLMIPKKRNTAQDWLRRNLRETIVFCNNDQCKCSIDPCPKLEQIYSNKLNNFFTASLTLQALKHDNFDTKHSSFALIVQNI